MTPSGYSNQGRQNLIQIERNDFINAYGNAGSLFFEVISWALQELLKESVRATARAIAVTIDQTYTDVIIIIHEGKQTRVALKLLKTAQVYSETIGTAGNLNLDATIESTLIETLRADCKRQIQNHLRL
jgi:hypothetical protein